MRQPFDGPAPLDSPDAHDARLIAPYLLRFYASVSNPYASVLTDANFDALIGQISWSRQR